jgi:hypothetical protein
MECFLPQGYDFDCASAEGGVPIEPTPRSNAPLSTRITLLTGLTMTFSLLKEAPDADLSGPCPTV